VPKLPSNLATPCSLHDSTTRLAVEWTEHEETDFEKDRELHGAHAELCLSFV
jgi:hypothetical protein